ncbi:MAG: PorT family protein [Muribaculaceae bacterium]|nr:PorT family protein [Muribaculaceae bacterium]
MKRTILLSALLLIFATFPAIAQKNIVSWGIKASIDAELSTKWHGKGGSITMYRPGVGFSIGGVSNIYLGKSFYFEPSLSIAYSQYRYKDVGFADADGLTWEWDPKIYKWNLQLPLIVGYSIDISDSFALNIFTGPQLRYAFAGKIVFKNKEIAEANNEYSDLWMEQRRFDLSWKIGLGVPVNNFVISLEADLGITDLIKSEVAFRENRLGLGITYYF